MAETSGAIDDIKNLKPPVLDHVTYLVLLEERLCLEILPALNEVLSNDEQLTQQIGWDLVHNLSSLPGSEACLETIARIGNPREIILKTLQSLDWIAVQCHVQAAAQGEEQEDSDDLPPQSNEGLAAPTVSPTVSHTQKFLALLSMLAILHRRIRTKHPSRFLVQTLQTVLRAYRADQQMTASVINLVRNLSGRRRPPLPTRKSSVHVANPDQDGDASRNVPDPEADAGEAAGVDPAEAKLQEQLLLCFVTCVLEQYVNKNKMAWAVRLLEHYEPEKIPPGKKTTLEAFREDQELLTRDAIVGTLAALAQDLGLNPSSSELCAKLYHGAPGTEPLAEIEDIADAKLIDLSTGGCICMLGYWIFSSTIFEADQRLPDIYLLPEHFQILQNFLGDSQHARIMGNPGAADALVALGHWLYRSQRVVKPTFSASEHPDGPETDRMSSFMRYLLSISLLAVYHPDIEVRNATVALAGHVFHADPVEGDKIQIAEDLFDECDFPHLKAQAVTWIREEFLLAHAGIPAPGAALGVFACPAALEELQHSLFPSIGFLRNQEEHEVASYVERELPFLLQVANFGLFLWSTKKWAHVIPDNMAATVQSRWLEPLRIAVERLAKAGQDLSVQAEVLLDRLRRLAEAEAFGGRGEAEHA